MQMQKKIYKKTVRLSKILKPFYPKIKGHFTYTQVVSMTFRKSKNCSDL